MTEIESKPFQSERSGRILGAMVESVELVPKMQGRQSDMSPIVDS